MRFEAIKKNLSTYNLDSLIKTGLYYVKTKNYNTNPFVISTYFEFSYLYSTNDNKPDVTHEIFNTICNDIFHIMDNHPLCDFEIFNPKKIFHVLAYQQFPFINNLDADDFCLQDYLFSNSGFETIFKQQTNFTVENFLKMSFKTWKWIDKFGFENLLPSNNNIGVLKDLISFVDILTLKHELGKNAILNYQNKIRFKTNEYYTFQPDAFVEFPFIKFNEQLFLIDKNIFLRTVKEYLYRMLLNYNNINIRQTFDFRFEKYFSFGIGGLNIPFIKENDLKSLAPDKEVCDYIVDNFLYAECKAIEMRALAQVNPTDTILRNNLDLIVKAYIQILTTANIFYKTNNLFGVIFTYEPFYFSDGTDIWDEILKEKIEAHIKDYNLKLLIPPDNLFFIDIRSWNRIIREVKNKGVKLKELFERAKNNNKDETTRKFSFDMHLDE